MRNLFDLYNGETLSVDQRQTNTGRTALIIAVQWDRYDVVRWLLDQGADPHYPSPRGTALYIGSIRVQDRHALPVHRRLSENVLELLQAHADTAAAGAAPAAADDDGDDSDDDDSAAPAAELPLRPPPRPPTWSSTSSR